jgi:hypothetical protein
MQRCRPRVVKILDDQTWPCHTPHLQNTPRISSDDVDDDPGPSCEQICTGMQEFSATWQPQATQHSTYHLQCHQQLFRQKVLPSYTHPTAMPSSFSGKKQTTNATMSVCPAGKHSHHGTSQQTHATGSAACQPSPTKAAVPLQEMRITSNLHEVSLCSKCIRFAVAMAAERGPGCSRMHAPSSSSGRWA